MDEGRFIMLCTRHGCVLPAWLFEAVTKDRDVLAISPKYFDMTSGLDRLLYRLARRHVGKQAGWIFTFRDLHGRSGSSQSYGDFTLDLRKAITRKARNALAASHCRR